MRKKNYNNKYLRAFVIILFSIAILSRAFTTSKFPKTPNKVLAVTGALSIGSTASAAQGLGDLKITRGLAVGSYSAPTTAGNAIFSGSVGIGTTDPTGSLTIGGTGQILASVGSVSAPGYSFVGETNDGMFLLNGTPHFVANGVDVFTISTGAISDYVGQTGDFYINTGFVGAAANPIYAFVGDNDTGMYSGGTNALAFTTGGAEKVRIDSSGNVGIGTTTPASLLHMINTATGNPHGITSDQYSADTISSAIQLRKSRGTASGDYTIVQSNDNVGKIQMQASNGTSFDNVALIEARIDGTPGSSTDMPGRLTFSTTPDGSATLAERMRINNAGNVGIGTTAPANLLDVTSSSTASHLHFGASTGGGYLTSSVDSQGALSGGVYFNGTNWIAADTTASIVSLASGAIKFFTYTGLTDGNTVTLGTAKVTIDSAGNVGIGTTAPVSMLSVGAAGNASAAISGQALYGVLGQGVGASNYGVLGYGVTGVFASGSTYDFYANGAGTDYGSSSSIRWKRDLQPINNALDKVLAMRGLYYTWDEAHGGKHDIGMIAEEVGKYVPEIVGWDPNAPGYAIGMDYGHLTPVLVEAIKEQQKQIDELKKAIEELKNK